jgi:Mg/Co/Ni transporter MgtE
VTFIVEIPVLLIIVGGSDRLCGLIGRWKFQLLIGFIPLCSAISGNVGLQSSDLTTQAISHGHISRNTYKQWLAKELGASACLGCVMGICLGLAAMAMTNFDIPFGFTITIAQFISIVMAGFTGTIAPILSTLFFKRDSMKWKGPLETAIQDVVGCFAMVILSYKILVLFSPHNVDASDRCTS